MTLNWLKHVGRWTDAATVQRRIGQALKKGERQVK